MKICCSICNSIWKYDFSSDPKGFILRNLSWLRVICTFLCAKQMNACVSKMENLWKITDSQWRRKKAGFFFVLFFFLRNHYTLIAPYFAQVIQGSFLGINDFITWTFKYFLPLIQNILSNSSDISDFVWSQWTTIA